MKILKLILLISLLTNFSACGENERESGTPQASIKGFLDFYDIGGRRKEKSSGDTFQDKSRAGDGLIHVSEIFKALELPLYYSEQRGLYYKTVQGVGLLKQFKEDAGEAGIGKKDVEAIRRGAKKEAYYDLRLTGKLPDGYVKEQPAFTEKFWYVIRKYSPF